MNDAAVKKTLKQHRALPDRVPVDASAWLQDAAALLQGQQCTLVWLTDAQGVICGFDVIVPGEGIVAGVYIV